MHLVVDTIGDVYANVDTQCERALTDNKFTHFCTAWNLTMSIISLNMIAKSTNFNISIGSKTVIAPVKTPSKN